MKDKTILTGYQEINIKGKYPPSHLSEQTQDMPSRPTVQPGLPHQKPDFLPSPLDNQASPVEKEQSYMWTAV